MKFVVLDAAIAVKWYVNEPEREDALRLLERDDLLFIAPDIFLAEVVNALLRHHRTGSFSAHLLDQALSDLALTAPQLISSTMLVGQAADLALRLRHPIYDCLYLALAERWQTEMMTADAKFVNICRKRLGSDPIADRLRNLEDAARS